MTILLSWTPDVGDFQGLTHSGNSGINNTYSRTGDYAAYMGPNGYIFFPFDTRTEVWTRVAYLYPDERFTTYHIRLQNAAEGRTHLDFSARPQLAYCTLKRGTTAIAYTEGNPIKLYTWHAIEIHAVIDDSSGICQVKVDCNLVIDYSGDTKDGGSTPAVDRLTTYCDNGVYGGNRVDDIMVRDDKWCGQGGIHLLIPNATGDVSDWTASAGNAYECVDEVPPSFSDYIYEDSSNLEQHLFNFTSIPNGISTINSVKVLNVATLSEAGSGSIKSIVKSGATISGGASVALDTSTYYVENVLENNPDTLSGWLPADITNLQAGVEVV